MIRMESDEPLAYFLSIDREPIITRGNTMQSTIINRNDGIVTSMKWKKTPMIQSIFYMSMTQPCFAREVTLNDLSIHHKSLSL